MIRDNNFSKNIHTLVSFVEYCQEHPDQRFWQALRNWNQIENPEEKFILIAQGLNFDKQEWVKLNDTFHRE